MKKNLFLFLLLAIISCQKENPKQSKCGFITSKFISDGITPSFQINDLPGVTIGVSQSEYDAHKIGDYYCY